MTVFDYITLDNQVDPPMKIQTNRDSTTAAAEDFFICDFDGLLDPGQIQGSAQGSNLRDGGSFDKNATVAGKSLTMTVYMAHSDREQLRIMYKTWINFLKKKNFILTTDWLGPYTAQYVSFILDEDGKGKGNAKHFKGTLSLVTKESW